jgi:hypothetical protein
MLIFRLLTNVVGLRHSKKWCCRWGDAPAAVCGVYDGLFTTSVFFGGATAMILLVSSLAVVMVWRYGRHLVGVVSASPIIES